MNKQRVEFLRSLRPGTKQQFFELYARADAATVRLAAAVFRELVDPLAVLVGPGHAAAVDHTPVQVLVNEQVAFFGQNLPEVQEKYVAWWNTVRVILMQSLGFRRAVVSGQYVLFTDAQGPMRLCASCAPATHRIDRLVEGFVQWWDQVRWVKYIATTPWN